MCSVSDVNNGGVDPLAFDYSGGRWQLGKRLLLGGERLEDVRFEPCHTNPEENEKEGDQGLDGNAKRSDTDVCHAPIKTKETLFAFEEGKEKSCESVWKVYAM